MESKLGGGPVLHLGNHATLTIGLDFDNTIASYDLLLRKAAAARGLAFKGQYADKAMIRMSIRRLPEGEILWQRIQAEVYGFTQGKPALAKGFDRFVHQCRARSVALCIVSHKPERAAQDGGINLREAAMHWMRTDGFFDVQRLGLSESDVFFEATRADKIKRISKLGCTHYVDDLEEVLSEPSFPKSVVRILFGSRSDMEQAVGLAYVANWDQLISYLFG